MYYNKHLACCDFADFNDYSLVGNYYQLATCIN